MLRERRYSLNRKQSKIEILSYFFQMQVTYFLSLCRSHLFAKYCIKKLYCNFSQCLQGILSGILLVFSHGLYWFWLSWSSFSHSSPHSAVQFGGTWHLSTHHSASCCCTSGNFTCSDFTGW